MPGVVAKFVGKRGHRAPGRLLVHELFFEVPRDHDRPTEDSLRLFARSVERYEKPVLASQEDKQRPWFLYLQGGPGFGCKSPASIGWVDTVLDKGYKILLLDQRGTGMSSTITARTLANVGSPNKQAAFLKHFRADSIVRDCESIRKTLMWDYPADRRKWSLLGQSFGGFCCVNYLSKFPHSLTEVFTTGGLPPLVRHPDIVYSSLFRKVAERNKVFYEKYPEDVYRVKKLIKHLQREDVPLPGGGKLSVLRLRQLGMLFGFHGCIDTVHEMIFRMMADYDTFGFLTRPTLASFEDLFSFDTAPLYALLHEAIYARDSAPNWSADRVMKQFPEFLNAAADGPEPVLFTGEMIFKGMLEDYAELQGLQQTADLLAKDDDWPELYDELQLSRNEVPVYSATYLDDMYVAYDLARETATKIKNCKTFTTNVMYHNALSDKTDELMKQLFALRDDSID